jgi:hypothetical protein
VSLLERQSFLIRVGANSATEVLREAGVPVTDSTLESLAAAGKGPRYRIINGRAVYQRADLEAWLAQQLRGEPAAA